MSKFNLYWDKEILPYPAPPLSLVQSRRQIDDSREEYHLPIREMFLCNNFRMKEGKIFNDNKIRGTYFVTSIRWVERGVLSFICDDGELNGAKKIGSEPLNALRVEDLLTFMVKDPLHIEWKGSLWRMGPLMSNGFGRWAIFDLHYVKDL